MLPTRLSNKLVKFCFIESMEVICRYLKGDDLFLGFLYSGSFRFESPVRLIEEKTHMTTLTLFLWDGRVLRMKG